MAQDCYLVELKYGKARILLRDQAPGCDPNDIHLRGVFVNLQLACLSMNEHALRSFRTARGSSVVEEIDV